MIGAQAGRPWPDRRTPAARQHPERDLAAEIENYLAENAPKTVPEIASAIRARESAVRYIVATDDRFQRAQAGSGRSARAKCWELAVPDDLTQPTPRLSGSQT